MLYRHYGITSPKTKQILKKAKDHLQAFERRKKLWVEGNIEGLLYEAMTIQQRFFFFLSGFFFHEHSRITELQGKGEGISLTPHYHFHPLHRQLDISRAIAAESSPLRIASSRTRAGNLWFPSASR